MVFVYITRHIVDHVINIELSPKVNTRQTPLSLLTQGIYQLAWGWQTDPNESRGLPAYAWTLIAGLCIPKPAQLLTRN